MSVVACASAPAGFAAASHVVDLTSTCYSNRIMFLMAIALPERRNACLSRSLSLHVCPKAGRPSFLDGVAVHHTGPRTGILNPVSNDGVLLNTTMLSIRVCNCNILLCSDDPSYCEHLICLKEISFYKVF